MTEKINVNEIFENAMNDPTLFSTLDIENLLDSIQNVKNDYLENKTMKDVTKDVYDKVKELGVNSEKIAEICNKLIGYRHVDELHELHKGKHIRWIRLNGNGTLTNGGIVVNIKFLDNGTQVLCMNGGSRFIQYKFDECLTFQKLSIEEQLILMAYENL